MSKLSVSDFLKNSKSKDSGLVEDFRPLGYWLDTGCLLMNLQVSGKFSRGFMAGTNIILSGDPSCGKSLLMEALMKNFLDQNELAMGSWYDVEHQLDPERFAEYPDLIRHVRKADIKEIKQDMFNYFIDLKNAKAVKKDIRTLVVLDSLGAMKMDETIEVDKEGYMKDEKADMMRSAKALTAMARDLKPMLYDANATVVSANWLYTDTSGFVPVQKERGGKGLVFQSHYCLRFTPIAGTKDNSNEVNKTVNKKILVETRKARGVKEQTVTTIPIEFNKGGFTRYGGLADFCDSINLIDKNGA